MRSALFTAGLLVTLLLTTVAYGEVGDSISLSGVETASISSSPTPGSLNALPEEVHKHRNIINGLYPLWETTGILPRHGEFFLGTSNIEVGLWNKFMLGIQPMIYVHSAPNVNTKFALVNTENYKIASQFGMQVLFGNLDESFFSTNYTSRIDIQDNKLWLLPISVSASWTHFKEIRIHNTLTALSEFGGGSEMRDQTSFGDALIVEVNPFANHSLLLHGGEIGFWNHDLSYAGASYRFNYDYFEIEFGYFYRFYEDGKQGSALISLGAWL